jgi:16S rRNA (cytosine1402-N4)-methyltransferase
MLHGDVAIFSFIRLAGTNGAPRSTGMTRPPAARWHEPVMAAEVAHWLAPRPGQTLVDVTVGTGGHSLALVPRLLPDGRLIAVDRDAEALASARRRLAEFAGQVDWVHGNFRDLAALLRARRVTQVDGILADLGMSSLQLGDAARGFSFAHDAPLDMRMDVRQSTTAADLLNTLPVEELARILLTFGEERFAARIARGILEARRRRPIRTTKELARLAVLAQPARARHGRLHAATRTFQALRIAVNDELGALQALLAEAPKLLRPGGRLAVVSYHSLEDRLVKRAFVEGSRKGTWDPLTPKPIRPSAQECQRNPRARSARLRVAQHGA